MAVQLRATQMQPRRTNSPLSYTNTAGLIYNIEAVKESARISLACCSFYLLIAAVFAYSKRRLPRSLPLCLGIVAQVECGSALAQHLVG